MAEFWWASIDGRDLEPVMVVGSLLAGAVAYRCGSREAMPLTDKNTRCSLAAVLETPGRAMAVLAAVPLPGRITYVVDPPELASMEDLFGPNPHSAALGAAMGRTTTWNGREFERK